MYRIVIADDEKLICDAILAVLNTAIPQMKSVKVFHNGKEAYDHVQESGADLLLLDIKMPGKSGLDIARLIHEQQPDCYVIIITAYRDFDYAKQAIDYNVNAFLTKPFSSRELIDTVRKGLTSFEQRESRLKDRHKAHRRLLRALCTDNTQPLEDAFHVLQDSVPFTELLCTEVIMKDDKLATLTQQDHSALKQLLTEAVEADTREQTSFLLKCDDTVSILIFSKAVPTLYFTENAIQVIHCYTGNMPQPDMKTYVSFAAYRTELSFQRQIDTFFAYITEGNTKQAQKQLAKYVRALPEYMLQSFATYVSGTCHITVEHTDPDTILQCMDTLITRSLSSQTNNYIIVSACEYIHKNFASCNISLETCADALSITYAHLSRLFKKHMKQNFSEYLLKARMEHARTLLETTNLPTAEIAVAVGYENTAYFRTSFKAYFQMTPRQYRQITCEKRGE